MRDLLQYPRYALHICFPKITFPYWLAATPDYSQKLKKQLYFEGARLLREARQMGAAL